MALVIKSEDDMKEDTEINDNNTFTLCTTGTIVGATVSALVYSAIQTTGELTASATSTGINLTGEMIALGADYIAGSMAGNTVRAFTHTAGALTGPAIKTTSQTAALGFSVLAGTMSALTTSLIIYGTKEIVSYTSKVTGDYKEILAKKVQYPVESDDILMPLENELLLLENIDECNLFDSQQKDGETTIN